MITLGYSTKIIELQKNMIQSMNNLFGRTTPKGTQFQRKYKIFKVNKETGEVESMKIRQV